MLFRQVRQIGGTWGSRSAKFSGWSARLKGLVEQIDENKQIDENVKKMKISK